jgi:hypothetical protein
MAREKKAKAPEVPAAVVCKGHNQLHMCYNCNDAECKPKGFFNMHRCKNLFNWILCMAGLMITLIALVAVYLVIRIHDNNWSDLTLPFTLMISFLALALIVIIIISTIDFKHRTGDAIYE